MSRRSKKKGAEVETAGSGAERWLLTYSDMITLLLALFILLYAMSSVDSARFNSLKHILNQSLHGSVMTGGPRVLNNGSSVLDSSNPSNAAVESSVALNQQVSASAAQQAKQMMHQVQQLQRAAARAAGTTGKGAKGQLSDRALRRLEKSYGIRVHPSERGIVISLSGDTYFESGSASLNPHFTSVLAAVAHTLRGETRPLSVEGNTDGQPIDTGLFPNNMALSSARALTVYDYLASNGVPTANTHIQGWGATRPAVVPKYATEPIAKNRRVDIVILAPGGNSTTALQADLKNEQAASGGAASPVTPISVPAGGVQTPIQPITPFSPDSVIGPIINMSLAGGAGS